MNESILDSEKLHIPELLESIRVVFISSISMLLAVTTMVIDSINRSWQSPSNMETL